MDTQYTDSIKEKRATTSQYAASKGNLDSLIEQLKEVQLASLMGNSKSSVILADSTDFGEKIDTLNKNLTGWMSHNSTALNDATKAERDVIHTIVGELKKTLPSLKPDKQDNSDVTAVLSKILAAVQVKPEVTVKASDVKMQNIVDLKPLERAIGNIKMPDVIFPETEDKFSFDDYRAHDLLDGTDKQYVGFVNPLGSWYIIENDIKANSMRYVFGNSNYIEAFDNAPAYQYETLDEAFNAAV